MHTESKTESKVFARWKRNTTSRYVNHVYTLPPKFLSVIKKFGSGWFFAFFASVASILRGFDSSEPPYKQKPQSRMAIVKFIHFISQHKAHIDPYTLISQKLVVFFLICGSSVASIKLSRWHPDVNFESPVILPLLLDKEVELFVFSIF